MWSACRAVCGSTLAAARRAWPLTSPRRCSPPTPRSRSTPAGDIRIGGTYATPRTVEIAHPLRDQPAHHVTVTAGAVATSGLRTRVWRAGDGFAHHLIDPARGVPAWTGVIQATALAPTALEAETLAKIALLSGPLAGRAALERYGGALILDSGKLILIGELDTRPGYPTVDRLTA